MENSVSQKKLVQLDYNDLPEWIQSSRLCVNQKDNIDDNAAEIIIFCPRKYSDFNLNIQSLQDVIRLLNIIQYWDVPDAPYELYEYLFNNVDSIDGLSHLECDLDEVNWFKQVIETYNQSISKNRDEKLTHDNIRYLSVLECACIMNSAHLLNYIVEYKKLTLLEVVSQDGINDLTMIACKHCSLGVLQQLAHCGVIFRAGCMRLAIKYGHSACIEFLKNHGCLWRSATESEILEFFTFLSVDRLKYILNETSIDIDANGENGGSALFIAALRYENTYVKLLLAHGADPNKRTGLENELGFGNTPLHSTNNESILQLLLDHGADVNIQNNLGETALYSASFLGQINKVNILLKHNASVNLATVHNETAIFAAASANRITVIEALLSHKADPNIFTDENISALWVAAFNGRFAIVDLLLCHEVVLDDNIDGDYYWLHVYVAACRHDAERLDYLNEYRCEMDVTNSKNQTPLYAVVLRGHVEATRLLMQYESDINVLTTDGDTPLQCAIRSRNADILGLLLRTNSTASEVIDNDVEFKNTHELIEIESILKIDERSLFSPETNNYLKRHIKGTRRWIDDEVWSWFCNTDTTSKQVFWLKASAG